MHPRRRLHSVNAIALAQTWAWRMWANQVPRLLRGAVLTAVLSAACVTPVIAAQLQLPPLIEPSSPEHHAGKVVLRELVTPDLATAKQFYAGLFGWTFRDSQAGGIKYAQASLDDHTVAGIIQRYIPAGEHRQPAWLSFISVPDVDAATRAASQLGGKVLFEPHSFPDRGREAVFADPRGAVFAVLASSSGDPPDVLAEPGEWIWSSLLTSDPDTDAAFYQALLDYEVFELPAAKGAEHFMLASENYARASVNSLPPNVPGMQPHWLNYVRVDDAAKMTAKVAALGGRVLVQPRVDRYGGRIAIVADPLGAPFGLLEWPSTENK